jgi:uncharacterized membrane protein
VEFRGRCVGSPQIGFLAASILGRDGAEVINARWEVECIAGTAAESTVAFAVAAALEVTTLHAKSARKDGFVGSGSSSGPRNTDEPSAFETYH